MKNDTGTSLMGENTSLKRTGNGRTIPERAGWILFWILLILPRILRILAPDVHIEDPNYMYGAFLILKGLVPFAEFAQVNPPLLETMLAILFRIFGVTYRIPEILSALAFLTSAVLIFRLGCRLSSRITGITASLLYSWHFLLFRYHVFERETFATLAVLAGLELLTRRDTTRWTTVSAGLIVGVGFAFKQTALIPFLAIAGILLVFRRQWKQTLLFCVGFGAFTGLITLAYSAVFGRMYMDQTFWFHWIKGYVAPWNIKALWTAGEMGFLLPAAAAGLWLLRKPGRDWNWLWPAIIFAELAFFWWVSGAFWPHYLLSTLPAAALLAGMAISGISRPFLIRKLREPAINIESGNPPKKTAGPRNSGILPAILLTTLAICVIVMQVFLPGYLTGSGSTARFGFSGTPREEVAAAARAIREHTSEDDLIISDPFIGLEAQRIKVIRFKDNWGLILWMQLMMERGEYREAVAKLSQLPFGEIRLKSHQYWMPLIETAFAEGRVGAVQPNYELPLSDTVLKAEKMKIVYQGSHYTIWARNLSAN